jgi:phosphoribosylamine--glycine ligase
MKVLVLGQGGREHAIVRSLKFSPSVTEVYAIPGSDGIAREAICQKISYSSPEFFKFIESENIELVVVGPEEPLAQGVVDRITALGVPVFGPDKHAAQLEASKIFAKEFMTAAGVPTSSYSVVRTPEEAVSAAQKFEAPYVLKADGLAAG